MKIQIRNECSKQDGVRLQVMIFTRSLPFLFAYLEICSNEMHLNMVKFIFFSLKKRADWRMGRDVGRRNDAWTFATVNMNGLQQSLVIFAFKKYTHTLLRT